MWRRAKRIIRYALALALTASLVWTALNIWTLTETRPGAVLVERTEAEIRAAYDRMMLREATPEKVNARYRELVTAAERDWVAITAIEDLAAGRDIVLDTDMVTLRDVAFEIDHSLMKQAGQCVACAWDPRRCDLNAALLCRVPIDLTPVGDVTGIVRESGRYALGMDVDMFELGLSTVGLGATVLAPLTLGSSASLKAGTGVVKLARRADAITPGMEKFIVRQASDAVDWAALSKTNVRSFNDDLARAARPGALRPLARALEDAGALYDKLGLRGTVHVLRFAENGDDVRRLSKATDAVGPEVRGGLELAGRSKVLRATLRWTDEAYALIASILGAVSAAMGLAGSMLATRALRILRALVRAR